MESIKDKTLELTFPCDWQYRLVGKNCEEIELAAKNVMGDKTYSLIPSRASSSGKFISLNLNTLIFSHEERLAIHEAIKKESAILYVL